VGATLRVGTSGFAYDAWKGPFYPPTLRDLDLLPYYASRFTTVELNVTFRGTPTERAVANWRARTPEGFVFAVKAHARITHGARLAAPAEAQTEFLERVRGLGEKLGPILFQTPPTFGYDRGRLEAFLDSLPPDRRYAMEFRHPSWNAARPLLAERGVAWCVADTDEVPADAIPDGPFAYLRLRKTAYDDEGLAAWADRIGRALAAGQDVFAYLKHEEEGTGPRSAARLAELVAGAGPERRMAEERPG